MNFLKKIIKGTLISVFVLALAACGNNGILAPKAPDLNKQFEMKAEVSWGDSAFSMSMSRTDIGKWQAILIEPYEVQGISFTYSRDTVSASMEGLSADQLTSDFDLSPLGVIFNSLENAAQDGNGAVTYTDGGYTVLSGDCLLSFEQGSAVPVGFEIAKEKISAKVSDFVVTGEIFKNGADVVLVQ